MNYGKAIQLARRLRGLKQGQLANRAGLTGSALSRVESSGRDTSFESFAKIAQALQIPEFALALLAVERSDLKGIPTSLVQIATEAKGEILLQLFEGEAS